MVIWTFKTKFFLTFYTFVPQLCPNRAHTMPILNLAILCPNYAFCPNCATTGTGNVPILCPSCALSVPRKITNMPVKFMVYAFVLGLSSMSLSLGTRRQGLIPKDGVVETGDQRTIKQQVQSLDKLQSFLPQNYKLQITNYKVSYLMIMEPSSSSIWIPLPRGPRSFC